MEAISDFAFVASIRLPYSSCGVFAAAGQIMSSTRVLFPRLSSGKLGAPYFGVLIMRILLLGSLQ